MVSSYGTVTTSTTGSIDISDINKTDHSDGINDWVITYDASSSLNKKVKLRNIFQTYYQRAVKTSADDTTTSSTVWSDVSDLSFTLPTSKTFLIKYHLIAESNSSTVAVQIVLNLGATHTIVGAKYFNTLSTASTAYIMTGDQTASALVTSMPAANLPVYIELLAIIRSGGTSGAIVPSFRSETGATQTMRIKQYSWGEAIQLD